MPDFTYSLNGSTIKTTPLMDQIRVAAEAGYTGIELWHDKIDEYLQSGGQLSDIRKALDDGGLTVPTTIYLCDWFDTSGQEHASALDECRRRLEQSAALGAIHVIASPPGGAANYELGAKNYHELLEIGAEFGVKPSMEFLGFVDQLNTIEDALEIVQKADHPDGTMVIDPFHIYRGGGDVESLSKLTASQIGVAHFMDTIDTVPREQQHDQHRVMPGDGCFPLDRYVSLLRQIGYNRFLSLELFREDVWQQDPLEVARLGLQKMRAATGG